MKDDLLKRIEEARRESQQATIEFVRVELVVGLTSLKLLKTRKSLGFETSGLEQIARDALVKAEKAMWKIRMKHNEFDQMVAMAERLRMEFEALKERE